MRFLCSIAMVGAIALPLAAEGNPVSEGQKAIYMIVKGNVVKAAQKMPEENYAFRPTPEIRTFGQLVGHIADAQYLFCSAASGENNPPPGVEKSKTSKADLLQALQDAFAYCDKVYNSMTDAKGAEAVKIFGMQQVRLSALTFNTAHNNEHYGNMVTYMRLKGLVPPSSEKKK